MWRAKLCCSPQSESSKRLDLEPNDEAAFDALLDLGCGVAVDVAGGLEGLVEIGRVADKYGMDELLAVVEEEALELLTLDTCAELLSASAKAGLRNVEERSKMMALDDFGAFVRTDGYLHLAEDTLETLLADDGLCAGRQEAVLEAVTRWKMAPGRNIALTESDCPLQSERLWHHIGFPLIRCASSSEHERETQLLFGTSKPLLTGTGRSHSEACSFGGDGSCESLSKSVLELRAGAPVLSRANQLACLITNDNYQHLLQTAEQAFCATKVGCRVVCGLWSGEMQVWDLATRTRERRLVGHTRVVGAVVAWGKWVVSGSSDGQVRAWDPETGRCEAILWGHSKGVSGLAECGIRLLSGSDDGTVRVWELRGPPREWRWERSLAAGAAVGCVAAWRWRAVAGGADGVIRVWDARTGVPERTLMGHGGAVLAMAVSGSRLMSSSDDSTLRKWSLVTGECEGQVEAGKGKGANKQRVRCLTTVGSNVVGGTELGQIWVWDRQSVVLVHSAEMPGRPAVRTLARCGLSMMGCVGTDVMVWGDI